jgi:predicted RNA binding protein YcfA (HicA-like mRNA interferase family)
VDFQADREHKKETPGAERILRRLVGVVQASLKAEPLQPAYRGSLHRQYKHPTKPGTVTVAGKPNLDVPPGTLNSVFKQAGLKKEK